MTELLESPEEFAKTLALTMAELGGGVWLERTAELVRTRDAAVKSLPTALDAAAEEIAQLCGCSTWDYPAQLVRWVEDLKRERDEAQAYARASAEKLAGYVRALYGDTLRMIAHHPGGDEVAEWMKAKAREALAKTEAAERGEIYGQLSAKGTPREPIEPLHAVLARARRRAVPAMEKWRANFIPAPHFYKLNQACAIIDRAFNDSFGCFLVGSSRERRDYRDVDVRLILEDAEYARLFRTGGGWTDALWSLLCTTLSDWLSQQTGLPVDFQIQQQTRANAQHPGANRRDALGIFCDYPGDRPSDPVAP